MKIFWLAAAGALGVLARYGITLALQAWMARRGAGTATLWLGADFPIGTLLINVSGSFILAFLTTLAFWQAISGDMRVVLGTGFCGGFTTFSTFELEAEGLLARGEWTPASVYIFGNLILGFVAVLLGRALALRLLGPAAMGGAG